MDHSEFVMIMSAEAWGLFLLACLMLNIAPGPDLVFVLSRAIAHGRKVGFAASLGVCSGALVHVLAAALGVSAILATSALAFSLIKYIGAAYLIWLGFKAITSREGTLALEARQTSPAGKPLRAWIAFRQGILIDILNPKAALFFLAFLPQFISHDEGMSSALIFVETLFLGSIVIGTGLLVEGAFVLLAAPLGAYLRSNHKLTQWLDRSFGGLLMGLGTKLALTD